MASGAAFDHVLIVVEDLDRSIRFYKLLGFEHLETIHRPDDRVGVMRLGRTKMELMCLREGMETHRPPRRVTDIGLRVDSIEEAYERLRDVIRFDSPPRPIAGRSGRMTVFFRDPDGVELHFVQE